MTLYSLDCLARFAPQIFGRALSLDGMFGSQVAVSGRTDHIDGHTAEMREAMAALKSLYDLHGHDPKSAQVLAYTHVLCGDEARRQGATCGKFGESWRGSSKAACPWQRTSK